MKKIWALLLAGVLLFGLVACGGEGERETGKITTTTTTTTTKGDATATTTTVGLDEDDEFYMLSDILMIKIAKSYSLTCSYEFSDGDKVPFDEIFDYFTFAACYTFDEKMLEPEMLPYYNEEELTFSVPHEIVDAYLVERFNTTPDPESVEWYNPKTGCYDFDRHIGEFYYHFIVTDKDYDGDNKYSFEVTLINMIDSEAVPPTKKSFMVQLTRDGYKILAYSREEA